MKRVILLFAILLGSVALQAQTKKVINQPYQFIKSPYVLLNTDTAAGRTWVADHYSTALYSAGTGISISGTTITNSRTYTSGSGITLSGTTFTHAAHSGDVTGITSLTVSALLGRTLSTITPTIGNVLKWDGTNWTPSAP